MDGEGISHGPTVAISWPEMRDSRDVDRLFYSTVQYTLSYTQQQQLELPKARS
jgi:hypothetical protein